MQKQKGNKKEIEKITKDMTFAEALQKNPQVAQIFFKHGMACAGCPMAAQESIEQGAFAHGLDVEKLVAELNKTAKKKK